MKEIKIEYGGGRGGKARARVCRRNSQKSRRKEMKKVNKYYSEILNQGRRIAERRHRFVAK